MTERETVFSDSHALMLREVGDVLDVGVLSVDRALVITGWNRWLETATGKRATDVIGQPLATVEPALRPAARSALEQAVNGITVVLSQRLHGYLLDIPVPGSADNFRHMQQNVRILPVYSGDKSPCGAVAIIQDVTERVVRENELRVTMEAAQAANQSKSNFLAAMSHELRTPIGAMSGYADLLREGLFGPVSDVQQSQLLRIKSVGSHLLDIVEEILAFARLEAGREVARITEADALSLAREALVAVEPLVVKKGLSLRATLPSAPALMHTDKVKVRQILINLLGNAVKFTERGSIGLEVRLSPDGKWVSFIIADTGPGISGADLQRIFEPFVQVSGSFKRSHEGTGLGLSVSRELARLLGGDISVTSTSGEGSVFTATIPANYAEPA